MAGDGAMNVQDGSGLEMIREEKGFGVSEFMAIIEQIRRQGFTQTRGDVTPAVATTVLGRRPRPVTSEMYQLLLP